MILLLSVLAGCAKSNQKIVIGERMPNFNVAQLSGTKANLTSLSKGQVTLIVFWATWCSRCREEVPHINELAASYGQSLKVIGVSVGELVQTVKVHIAGLNIQYLVVVTRLSDSIELGIDGIPRMLLLDSEGQIQQIESSVNESLQERIRQLVTANNPLGG